MYEVPRIRGTLPNSELTNWGLFMNSKIDTKPDSLDIIEQSIDHLDDLRYSAYAKPFINKLLFQ